MPQEAMIRWADVIVIGLFFCILIVIGFICSRRNKDSESYFLAGRNMPGWVVGFSLMATIISSMTFLAAPGFAYAENWRYMPCHIGYLIAVGVMIFFYMPFFRRSRVSSAYEYLEKRFGLWARLYAAAAFVLFQVFRLGIILYAVSLPIQEMIGLPLPYIILLFGIVVTLYTIVGGIEAVIWTDVLQGCTLIIGGFICLPIIVARLPGGFGQIIEIAVEQGKLSVGSTAFSFSETTMWVMILFSLFNFLQIGCIDQMTVQRYCAPRSERESVKALLIGAALSLPVWIYFTFIGTAIFVFYYVFPDPEIDGIVAEQVLPFFIFREVPAGLAGFVIAGLLAAAMSTLDSTINALANTVTEDFYRRLFIKSKSGGHYLRAGQIISTVFGVLMIITAIAIHYTRTTALQDFQTLITSVLSGGLMGLFWLGFLTRRVDGITALIAVITTLFATVFWLFAGRFLPEVGGFLPHEFMMIAILNLFLFGFGCLVSVVLRKKKMADAPNLTIWTLEKES